MRSMMVAVDNAPPAHIVISAVDLSERSSSCSAVVIRREPVEPTGCPSAMAPPLTLTLRHVGLVDLRPRQDDRRERLVDLDDVDVAQRHSGLGRAPCGWTSIGPSRW